MTARLVVGAVLLAGTCASWVLACGDSSSGPLGSGDKVYVDVDATVQMGPPAADGGGVFARGDSSYGTPDGYDPAALCKACACSSTEYCFGGGPGYETFSGDCHPTTFGIGCQPLDASPCPDASCTCLVNSLRDMLAGDSGTGMTCYADCVQDYRAVYCPSP